MSQTPSPVDSTARTTRLDVEAALDRFDGERDLYRKTLERFFARYTDVERELTELLLAAKQPEARRVAHDLKSTSALVGLGDVSRAAAKLEYVLASDAIRPPLLEAVHAELDALRPELAAAWPEVRAELARPA